MVESPTLEIKPDWGAFINCLKRKGAPRRVHYLAMMDEEWKYSS